MSLVVVRKHENDMFIVSDTKLTYTPLDNRHYRNSPEDGVLKTLLLSSQLAISFAGDVEYARQAITEIGSDQSIDRVIEILKSHHLKSSNDTEFILCGFNPQPLIHQFKNGENEAATSAWIGDSSAFEVFQKSYLSDPEKKVAANKITVTVEAENQSVFEKMSTAMDDVINDSNIKSVGGFKIEVASSHASFRYRTYMAMFISPHTITLQANVPHFITHQSPQKGGYTVNLYGSSPDFQHIGLHIKQGNFVIIYRRISFGLPEPQLFADIDEIDFQDEILPTYGILPAFCTQDRFTKYRETGLKYFSEQKYLDAANWFDKGSILINDKEKAELTFYKGICMMNLKNIKDGFAAFTHAMELDSAYEYKTLEMLENRIISILKKEGIIPS